MIAPAVIAWALVTVAPRLDAETRARYAEDIAAEVDDVETGLALVATAKIESDFRRDVETCKVTGDDGAALGLYQLHAHWRAPYTAAQVCRSNRLSTRLAVRALKRLRDVTGSFVAAFAPYVGVRDLRDARVARRIEVFRRLSREVPNG